jgi:hypothetical protein
VFVRATSLNYLTYFMLTLLPLYLVRERHLSLQSMVKLASAYCAIEALSAITTGWLDPKKNGPDSRSTEPGFFFATGILR